MPKSISNGYALNEEERALLQGLTGNDYAQVFRCGLRNQSICAPNHQPETGSLDSFDIDREQSNFRFRSFLSGDSLGRVFNAPPVPISPENLNKYDALNSKISRAINPANSIVVISRKEPLDQQLSRIGIFQRCYERLTPEMAENIESIDFRSTGPGLGGYSSALNPHYFRIGNSPILFEHTLFHEITHGLKLPKTWKRWNEIDGNHYLGESWKDNPRMLSSSAMLNPLDGKVSWYAYSDGGEDIAELTAYSYLAPGFVRFLAEKSPILKEKLRFLLDNHYISDQQYQEIVRVEEGPSIEAQWTKAFRCAENLSEAEMRHAGDSCRTSDRPAEVEILRLLDQIERGTRSIQTMAITTPRMLDKLEFLRAHQMISEIQYDILTSASPKDSAMGSDEPPPVEGHSWVEGIRSYMASLLPR